MKEKVDPRSHIGEVHGVYKIVDVLDEKDKYGHWIYKGICQECGYVRYTHYGSFSGEHSKTIECRHVEHGGRYLRNIKWDNKRISSIFRGMKARCYDEHNKSYKWYGGKGIKICDEWLDNPKLFEEWSLSNGYGDNLTIDRIDETKDYCPENCRWVTVEDNSKNKPTTNFLEANGEKHTGREWSEVLGLSMNLINKYVKKYGKDNTEEFIKRYLENPGRQPKHKQSLYDLYMND